MSPPSPPARSGGAVLPGGKRRLEHFVLTNFNVYRSDADRDRNGLPVRTRDWLKHRFDLFERFCLPSVAAQSRQDFTWLVKYDGGGTPRRFRRRLQAHEAALPSLRLVSEPISFRTAVARLLGSRSCRLLTTRLDNDDALHRTAIERLRLEAGGHGLEFLNFPVGYCLSYPAGEVRLFEYASNPFISLAEDYEGDEPQTAACTSHSEAADVAPVRQLDREPSWLQLIHGRNASNVIRGRPCAAPDLSEAFNSRLERAAVR